MEQCRICKRAVLKQFLEKHHLVPKAKKGKEIILVCCDCGNQIHKLFSIKELTKQYNSLEKLLNNEKIQRWIEWIRKRKEFGICMKAKK